MKMRAPLATVLVLTIPSLFGAWQEKPPEEKAKERQVQETPESPAAQPSLAELARKTKKDRAGQESGATVYTNASYRNSAPGRVSTSRGFPASSTSQSAPGAGAATPAEEIDLTQLQASISEAKMAYMTAVNQNQVLQLRMNDLNNRFYSEADPPTQGFLEASLNKAFQELSDSEKTASAARKVIEDLESLARGAGVEPGVLKGMVGDLPEIKRIVDDDFRFSQDEEESEPRRRRGSRRRRDN